MPLPVPACGKACFVMLDSACHAMKQAFLRHETGSSALQERLFRVTISPLLKYKVV